MAKLIEKRFCVLDDRSLCVCAVIAPRYITASSKEV